MISETTAAQNKRNKELEAAQREEAHQRQALDRIRNLEETSEPTADDILIKKLLDKMKEANLEMLKYSEIFDVIKTGLLVGDEKVVSRFFHDGHVVLSCFCMSV